MERKKLRKSAHDKMLSGTLGGIAEYLGVESTIVRIVFLLFCWSGLSVFAYIALAIVVPEADRSDKYGSYSYKQYYRGSGERKEAKKVEEDDEWSDF